MARALRFERESTPREHMITVRVNDRERAILEAAMEVNERSISSLLRACVNGVLLDDLREKRPDIYKLITNKDPEK